MRYFTRLSTNSLRFGPPLDNSIPSSGLAAFGGDSTACERCDDETDMANGIADSGGSGTGGGARRKCAGRAGGTVGFEEDFALSPDRNATLSQLIPGTDDFYYYTALNEQNQGKLDDADATIKAWVKQLGRTARAQEMENRQALLKYPKAGKESLDYLTRILNLQFNHEKETLARQAALPTELDPNLISRDTLTKRALAANPQTLGGFENSALDWLIATNLSDERLHELLSRLTRPDVDDLPKLVARDLATKFGSGFGSLQVHHKMLLAQLDDLLKLKPELLNDSQFVHDLS